MQRIVIPVNDAAGDNIGAQTVSVIQGHLTSVQFSFSLSNDTPTNVVVQLAIRPSFSAPVATTGLNPMEVAYIAIGQVLVTTGGGPSQVNVWVPADFPVAIGTQLFVNSVNSNGSTLSGAVVCFVE